MKTIKQKRRGQPTRLPSKTSEEPPRKHPKYYLEDVPQHLRIGLLDLCFRRLYHNALELLRRHRFHDYTLDDLINFYHWAPATLPGQTSTAPEPPKIPRDYDQPSPEQLADIRKRLDQLPPDVLDRFEHALKHDPVDNAGSLAWKAGVGFTSAELYEFRKTLFTSNTLADPYTSGPPTLCPTDHDCSRGREEADAEPSPPPVTPTPAAPTLPSEDGSTSAGSSGVPPQPEQTLSHTNPIVPITPIIPNPEPQTPNPEPTPQLREHRQRLVDLLASRADPRRTEVAPLTPPIIPVTPIIPDSSPLEPKPSLQPGASLHDPAALLSDLREIIGRHVVLPEMAAEALALWVVHTYAFTLRQVTTYIGVVSPEKRCGKTTLLEVLARLANRALTAANISPSALFKVIQETSPTLLIDEADTFLERRDELAGILNAGYRKDNAYVVRVTDASTAWTYRRADKPEFGEWTNERPDGRSTAIKFAQYSCWCPKVMAAIGRLPDTLADRCIVITMQRKLPGEKCARLRSLNAVELRKRCAAFVQQHHDAIANAQPEIPAALNDRAADIWEPLLAIADLAGADWPALARQAALKLSAAHNDELTLIGYFLRDIRALMLARNTDRILSRHIIANLNPRHDRAWEDFRRGREINEYWLSQRMKELGIHSRNIRIGDLVAKGYVLEDIEAAYRRYVPSAEAQLAKGKENE